MTRILSPHASWSVMMVIVTALIQGCAAHIVPMAPAQIATVQNVDEKGVGLSGYDPVAFFTEGKPVKGNPQYQSRYANYGEATYYFASSDHKSLFDQNPEKFAPQYGGYCATAMSMGKVEEIQVEYFVVHNHRLLMQRNKMAKMVFMRDPDVRVAAADKNWPGLLVQPVRARQE